MWRFDNNFRALRRELPWLRTPGREYFAKHIRVSSFPFDRAPEPERMAQLCTSLPELEKCLCYASGYPSWDADSVAAVVAGIPASWAPSV
jgi:uncharacterized protein